MVRSFVNPLAQAAENHLPLLYRRVKPRGCAKRRRDQAGYAAKALAEHRQLFQVQLEPWYYDPDTVAVSKVIPLHPGAMRYYRERGWVR